MQKMRWRRSSFQVWTRRRHPPNARIQQQTCRGTWSARAHTLVPQRDSDANRGVLASRASALRQFFSLALKTGANLIQQFRTVYIPRVFCTTLPCVVGGPDFPRQARSRQVFEDSEPASLDAAGQAHPGLHDARRARATPELVAAQTAGRPAPGAVQSARGVLTDNARESLFTAGDCRERK